MPAWVAGEARGHGGAGRSRQPRSPPSVRSSALRAPSLHSHRGSRRLLHTLQWVWCVVPLHHTRTGCGVGAGARARALHAAAALALGAQLHTRAHCSRTPRHHSEFVYKDYVRLPTKDELVSIEAQYRNKMKLPNCIGSVDGSFFHILQPAQEVPAYFCYKKYYAILILAVVDTSLRFRMFQICESSASGDAAAWNASNFYRWAYSAVGCDLRGGTFEPPRQAMSASRACCALQVCATTLRGSRPRAPLRCAASAQIYTPT